MKILIIFLVVLAAVAAMLAAKQHMKTKKPAGLQSGLQFTDKISIGGVGLNVAVADDLQKKTKGLSGHSGLEENQAMLFDYAEAPGTHSFWMKDMLFPIDIIWVRDNVVVDISRDVPPPQPGTVEANLPRYSPAAPADTIIEVAAGWSARHNVGEGSKVDR